MRNLIIIIFSIVLGWIIGVQIFKIQSSNFKSHLQNEIVQKIKPLDKYSYENLRKRVPEGSDLNIGRTINATDMFSSHIFTFKTAGKTVSGLLTMPVEATNAAVLLVRGYVDKSVYTSGEGTRHVGEYFAGHGYITFAPDFLGYGESDPAAQVPIEERFQTYTTVLDLLDLLQKRYKVIGIWGHSNGGQVALSVLEVSGISTKTVLWAPVSKPFPYSILYFTDDASDHGKYLRKIVSQFEQNYDSEKYSVINFVDWIKAPIQIHQGEADESVPLKWSDDLHDMLKMKNKNVEYFTYTGEDHNFDKGNWNTAVERSLTFYRGY